MRASFTLNPLDQMEALRRELDRALTSCFVADAPASAARRAHPPMNFREDAGNLYVQVLIPGADPESLNVEINNGFLRVSGQKRGLGEDAKPETRHREERAHGQFSRAIELPVEVDRDNTTAEYRDGILRVTLPKSEKAKPRKVSVTTAN